MTPVGAKGARDTLAQVEVRGVNAAAFYNYGSRSVDPQLDTHVGVANRVQVWRNGKWCTLDSRALDAAVTELSEHCNAALANSRATMAEIGREWGVSWKFDTPIFQVCGSWWPSAT